LVVLRLLDKVAVIWEVKHFGGNPQALQGSEELKSRGNSKKIIALSVNYHRRGFELCRMESAFRR
jgi:hypothetical protein